MPSKAVLALLLCALMYAACGRPSQNSEAEQHGQVNGGDVPEVADNSFSIREIESILVHHAPLGTTPCCGFSEEGLGPWGIWVRALGNFPNPPKNPSIQPGTDGIESLVVSAEIHLEHEDGKKDEITRNFSANEHCQSQQHFEGLVTHDFRCFLPEEGEENKYRLWQEGEQAEPGAAYAREEAPKGSKEEMYFRSIHPDFPHYGMAFNRADGTRHLGVQVVFWADEEVMEKVNSGDAVQLLLRFEDGTAVSSKVDIP